MSTQLERPKTGRGSRSRMSNIPPRPTSRHGGFHEDPFIDSDEEGHGRPASRVGFSPEVPYRYSHDEYSRQHSVERRHEFPGKFPTAADDKLEYQQYRDQPGERFSISPTPGDATRQSPQFDRYSKESSVHRDLYRQSPQYSQMVRIHGDDGLHGQQRPSSQEIPKYGSPGHRELYRQSPQYGRTSSGDHYSPQDPSSGDARYSPYRETYQDSYMHSQNSFTQRESDQSEPQYVDTQYEHGEQYPDPIRQEDVRYSRPPIGQRPKSARPKTARKKSAKQRQKHTDESPSQKQVANHEQPAFLAAGDPYGRPSSSLSRYKPLPAIGSKIDPRDKNDTSISQLTSQAQVLSLDKYETKDSKEIMSNTSKFQGNEGIHGASSFYRPEATDHFEPSGVSVLTDFPRHLSNEIFKSSLASFEKGMSEERDAEQSESNEKEIAHSEYEKSSVAGLDDSNADLTRPLLMKHKLPLEPDSNETRVLLAIRLPDGKRHQHYFRPSEPLEDVLFFIENESGLDFSAFNLACNTPKCVFDDLTVSINDAKLQDRTVLYLEQR
ncbi:hypothetical protein CHS0354_026068 [Potamilus streckersoni]|uniref:UBX domain-containing protein n=1 Tax=Potamilus streckersoni TaxID=2493646 RepID=A0AAE0SFM7_9BIVA|nr:hypothetical protein CHS0354_026068 [Potamilus streckersoni]